MFAYNREKTDEDRGGNAVGQLGVSADMLYTLYAWQQTALAPLRLAAVAGQHFFSASTFPFVDTRTARAIAAACELVERSTRTYPKPPFGIDTVTIRGRELPVYYDPQDPDRSVVDTGELPTRR